MSQHDLNVANQSRTNFRQDLNNALEAIASKQSGPGDPAITYSFQEKIDTSVSPAVVYIRNAANTAWVRIGYINASTGQLILDNATDADTLDGTHLASLLLKAGGSMTGAINEAADTIAAHATTCDIWSKPNNITLTGDAVTFTDFPDAPQAGAVRWIKSNAVHVLTNNANLIVQGGANVTLASGDWLRVEAITTTTFNILVFRADGKALVATSATRQFIHVRDEKDNGVNGGSTVSGTTYTRVFNTVVYNNIGASLASNQLTLPAGTYKLWGRAPAESAGKNRCAVYNTITSAYIALGSSEYSLYAHNGYTESIVVGIITLAAESVLELRHYIESGHVDIGLGLASSSGLGNEVYAEMLMEKLS